MACVNVMTMHSRRDIPQMDGNSERAAYGSNCRTQRPQQNAEWCTDDLGCVLGLNLYIAPSCRDINDLLLLLLMIIIALLLVTHT